MQNAARVGIASAGGTILGGGPNHVRIDGAAWSVVGAAVAGHGSGSHAGPVMSQGSSIVRIDGIAACIAGNAASCGHTASGASHVQAES